MDPEVEPGCVGKLRRLSRGLSGPNFDLGPHFSALILSLSTFSFSMHFFAFSDTEINLTSGGKEEGPYARLRALGAGEGDSRFGAAIRENSSRGSEKRVDNRGGGELHRGH